MPERLRPFGTSLVRQCPQGLFRPDLKSTHSPWISEDGKNEAQVANYYNYELSRDIGKNPGPPTYVDPNKTMVALYSQGNELVFGQKVGQQCVAMSLCSLIYDNTHGISSANDLIQIINIGTLVILVLLTHVKIAQSICIRHIWSIILFLPCDCSLGEGWNYQQVYQVRRVRVEISVSLPVKVLHELHLLFKQYFPAPITCHYGLDFPRWNVFF